MAVEHDVGSKFFISLPDGEEAVLVYSRMMTDNSPSTVLDLHHTEVPPSQRGKGLGGILAEAAFSYARSEGIKVILTCTYLQHYASKHSKHDDIILHHQEHSR